MIKITDDIIDEVVDKSQSSLRRRYHYNFHKRDSEPIQRFLNALEPEGYVRPHKHEDPDKVEIFIILRGKILVVEFDDEGKIVDYMILDSKGENKGVEIPPKTWHSVIALEKGSVLYIIKEGPFNEKSDKILAKWSPEEGTKEAEEFNRSILRSLNIQMPEVEFGSN